jgi:hypothetical protein
LKKLRNLFLFSFLSEWLFKKIKIKKGEKDKEKIAGFRDV